MSDYSKLVKALRGNALSKQCDSCKYGYHLCQDSECNDACNVEQIYADAAAAIEELQQIADHHEQTAKDYWKEACEYKAQLPKRGKWIDRYDEDDKPFFKRKYVCSACSHWNTYGKSNYCPNCGAKMGGME